MGEKILEKPLTRMEFKFGKINPDDARAVQYELLKDPRVWRAFLNGYSKDGFVVFDCEALPKEEVLKKLEEFEPEVRGVRKLTAAELVEESMSWNNVLEKAGA